jgi:hypothetical protein
MRCFPPTLSIYRRADGGVRTRTRHDEGTQHFVANLRRKKTIKIPTIDWSPVAKKYVIRNKSGRQASTLTTHRLPKEPSCENERINRNTTSPLRPAPRRDSLFLLEDYPVLFCFILFFSQPKTTVWRVIARPWWLVEFAMKRTNLQMQNNCKFVSRSTYTTSLL